MLMVHRSGIGSLARMAFAAVLLLAGLFGATASADEPATEKIDARTYCDVARLRGELRLGNEDLAAMGCTEEQAKDVLSRLLDWYRQNAARWQDARRQTGRAEQALRQAIRKVNVGPRDAAVLRTVPTLRQQAATAKAAEQAMVVEAGPVATGALPAAQQQAWTTIRSQPRTGRYRHVPGLTDAQRKALRKARTAQARQSAEVKPGQPAVTIQSQAQIEAVILTPAQQQTLAAVRQRIQQYGAGVQKAAAEVLPVPEELKAPTATEEIDPRIRPVP